MNTKKNKNKHKCNLSELKKLNHGSPFNFFGKIWLSGLNILFRQSCLY